LEEPPPGARESHRIVSDKTARRTGGNGASATTGGDGRDTNENAGL
jgi:hypothetical protein